MCGVWKAVAIKPDMCEYVATLYSHLFGECGDEGMTLLNLCQVIKTLALFGVMWQTIQLISGSIEQVSSPASPGGGFRYMLGHVWSKSPNIVELG